MIDIGIIREKYASMTDEQLIYLVKVDSEGLTEEAMSLLKEEFTRRGLDMPVAADREQPITEETLEPIDGFYNPATSAEDSLLGRNYLSIKNPALEQELAQNEKQFADNVTEEDLTRLIKKCDNAMLMNGAIFIAGILITLATYIPAAEKGGTYFLLWGPIIYGGYRFFGAFADKNKYRALRASIQEKQGQVPGTDGD